MANDVDLNEAKNSFEYRDGNLYWKMSNSPRALKGSIAGNLNSHGYIDVRYNKKLVKAHRIIFGLHHGYIPEQVDHINGNRSDNRIENLRAANNQTNQFNRACRNGVSGLKNIYWRESRKRWFVKLCLKDKQVWLGSYKELELAELVAIEARNKYHKEFACHE